MAPQRARSSPPLPAPPPPRATTRAPARPASGRGAAPAPNRKPPAYRQRSGYSKALVTLTDSRTGRRRDYWLGEYGSPGSRELYFRLLAEWEAAGRRLPDLATVAGPAPAEGDPSVAEVVRDYWRWAKTYYSGSALSGVRMALRVLRECFGYPPALKEAGLYFSQAIVWDKEHPVLTRKDFLGCFEIAYYGWHEGAAHQFFGPNNAPDLWHVKKVAPQKMSHLTEKPVELAARAMAYSSKPGERVLDLFGGSGSTLIAAEQQGRRAYLMEIDPAYCDIIRTRWEIYSGGKAERAVGEPAEQAPAARPTQGPG